MAEAKQEKYYARLNSIARLLQGESGAAAVHFDDNHLWTATNKPVDEEFVTKILAYMSDIAKLAYKAKKTKSKEEKSQYKQKAWQAYLGMEKYFSEKSLTPGSKFCKFPTLAADVQRGLKKVTGSIVRGYLNPTDIRAFPKQFCNALKNRNYKRPIIKENIHAELQIVEHFYASIKEGHRKKIDFYVGVSKKCCPNCAATIKAINTVLPNNQASRILFKGNHEKVFMSGIPKILAENEAIKKEFLRIRNVATLEDAFYTIQEHRDDAKQAFTASEDTEDFSCFSEISPILPVMPIIPEQRASVPALSLGNNKFGFFAQDEEEYNSDDNHFSDNCEEEEGEGDEPRVRSLSMPSNEG